VTHVGITPDDIETLKGMIRDAVHEAIDPLAERVEKLEARIERHPDDGEQG